jgi:hypothetical protein
VVAPEAGHNTRKEGDTEEWDARHPQRARGSVTNILGCSLQLVETHEGALHLAMEQQCFGRCMQALLRAYEEFQFELGLKQGEEP